MNSSSLRSVRSTALGRTPQGPSVRVDVRHRTGPVEVSGAERSGDRPQTVVAVVPPRLRRSVPYGQVELVMDHHGSVSILQSPGAGHGTAGQVSRTTWDEREPPALPAGRQYGPAMSNLSLIRTVHVAVVACERQQAARPRRRTHLLDRLRSLMWQNGDTHLAPCFAVRSRQPSGRPAARTPHADIGGSA